jgi:hypothetical protein
MVKDGMVFRLSPESNPFAANVPHNEPFGGGTAPAATEPVGGVLTSESVWRRFHGEALIV